jgi:5-methylcytosine-specific restriction endonuclease McrBC regulatory subunit McrC
LHELKCQALQALGEIEPAAREAERAKSVYETTEDFESMARMNRVIKSTVQSLTTHEQKVVKQQEELGELPGGYWH